MTTIHSLLHKAYVLLLVIFPPYTAYARSRRCARNYDISGRIAFRWIGHLGSLVLMLAFLIVIYGDFNEHPIWFCLALGVTFILYTAIIILNADKAFRMRSQGRL